MKSVGQASQRLLTVDTIAQMMQRELPESKLLEDSQTKSKLNLKQYIAICELLSNCDTTGFGLYILEPKEFDKQTNLFNQLKLENKEIKIT